MDRAEVQSDPVTEMRDSVHTSNQQAPGRTIRHCCCVHRKSSPHEFDTGDMGKRFVRWYQEELWTPHGKTFDVGVATARALTRIANGMRAEVAGGDDQFSNGNGSLMRILPVSLRFADCPIKQPWIEFIERPPDSPASSIPNGLRLVYVIVREC